MKRLTTIDDMDKHKIDFVDALTLQTMKKNELRIEAFSEVKVQVFRI